MQSRQQKIILRSNRIFRKNQIEIHQLNYLFWECTLRCNQNCLHCGSDCRHSTTIKDMPAEDFLSVVRKLPEICNPNETLIVFTGGEPLVRKDLEFVGLELYKLGFPWGMVTNGFSLTRERFQNLMKSGLRTLSISLDGLAESHDWLRGTPKSFERAVQAIRLATQEPDLVFDVVTSVHTGNLKELPELEKLLESLGVKKWRLLSIFPKGRALENNLVINRSENLHQLMQFIKNTRKKGIIHASYGCEGFLGEYELQVRDNPFFCRAGISVGSVLADGGISACPSLDREFVQGNIYRHEFNDIWQNRFQIMRDRRWARTGICLECDQWKNCLGNGLHLRNPWREGPLYCQYHMLEEAHAEVQN